MAMAPLSRVPSLLLALLLPLSFVALPGCEEDHDDGHSHKGSGAECKEGSTLTWDSFGEKFMTDYCTRCHSSSLAGAARLGAPSDHNLDTVLDVREQIEHIDEQAAAGPDRVGTAMPIGASNA